MPFTNFFNTESLQFKIIALFIIVLVLPLSIIAAITLKRISDVANQDLKQSLDYSISIFENSLNDYIQTQKLNTKTTADFDLAPLSQLSLPASDTVNMLEKKKQDFDLDYAAVVESQSRIKFTVGAFPIPALQVPLMQTFCFTPLNANLYVINDEPWVFSAAQLMNDEREHPLYVVFGKKIPRNFADKFKNFTAAEYTLLYANKRILTTLIDSYANRDLKTYVKDPEKSGGYTEVFGNQYYYERRRILPSILEEAITLETQVPVSPYMQLRKSMTRDFTFFAVMSVILALATGTTLAIKIANPVSELSKVTSRIADGDLTPPKPLRRQDEIGVLTDNYIKMVKALKREMQQKERRMTELNTLFEISNAVNLISNSEELLQFLLAHSIKALRAEKGSIMLLDDETDELVVRVSYGSGYKTLTTTPVKLGEGVCGKVAATGEGIIANDGFKDQRFSTFDGMLPVEDIITLISAPMKFKDGIIGVINIINKKNKRNFNENDLSLLNLIASQAAVTIENNKLYELSITDGLSRLYVHRYFQARLSEELLRARRYALKCSLVLIDIDHFKNFNDTYGHQVGDDVIRLVAGLLKDTVRTGIDIPCRYGGEEMTVILPETNSQEAFRTAERLRKRIEETKIPHKNEFLSVTVSIGVASYPEHAKDKDTLINAADKAMYVSKGEGRNRTTLAS
ncbi:MAG: diguanylate cyclase [Candidatus Riflebacteria bacterium]|nr:diguanylate cyclase [Candidatus Riflebacteria bacterium]